MKKQNVSPAPEFPFGEVFQTNFQGSKTETERYQQHDFGDFQMINLNHSVMLKANSTDGITTLPLHQTCPA